MSKLFWSATKIVFIMIATTVCAGFLMWQITGDQFLGIAALVFAFYYRSNATTSENETAADIQTTTSTQSTTTKST